MIRLNSRSTFARNQVASNAGRRELVYEDILMSKVNGEIGDWDGTEAVSYTHLVMMTTVQ